MTQASQLAALYVPRWIVERSWSLLRDNSRANVESEVFWGGRIFGSAGIVFSIVRPFGPGTFADEDHLFVDAATVAAAGRWWTTSHQQIALAQVHAHPGTWVGHSRADDAGALATDDGFISIVWPEFCRGPSREPNAWGIHEIVGGHWRRWGDAEVSRRLNLVESEAEIAA